MEGSGGGSPSESEITEIGKTPDPTSNSSEHESHGSADGGGSEGGGGDGASGYAAEVKVEEGESVMGDAGSHHGRTTEILPPPPPDGINRSRKSDDKVVQHADTAVAPVASTSFKRSGGTGASSRRTAQKRVVTVPIAEIGEGVPRPRSGTSGTAAGEGAPPPSDSWTWRKYGQKPIKGSPYPRGYYRCSSSKGCPARKQVERSRADPKMLIVTYASDHNHPWPLPRNGTHHASRNSTAVQASLAAGPPPQVPPSKLPSSCADEEDMEVEYEIVAATEEEELVEDKIIPQPIISISTTTTSTDKATTSSPSLETSSADNSLSGASDDSTTLIPPLAPDGVVDDLCSTWFPVVDHEISLCSTTADTATKMMIPFSYDDLYADLLGNKRPSGGGCGAEDDDDSLFAGLGELPEFSLVFRRGVLPELDADFTRGW